MENAKSGRALISLIPVTPTFNMIKPIVQQKVATEQIRFATSVPVIKADCTAVLDSKPLTGVALLVKI